MPLALTVPLLVPPWVTAGGTSRETANPFTVPTAFAELTGRKPPAAVAARRPASAGAQVAVLTLAFTGADWRPVLSVATTLYVKVPATSGVKLKTFVVVLVKLDGATLPLGSAIAFHA